MTPGDAALLSDPIAVFGYLAGLMAFLFWLGGLRPLQKFFNILPPSCSCTFCRPCLPRSAYTGRSSHRYTSRPWRPVGLLMAVLGYILGTYVGLGAAWLPGQMALRS